LYGPRIVTDQVLRHAADHGGKTGAAVALVVFRPADQSFIGRDLEKREVAPAGIAVQILDLGGFHGMFPLRCRSIDQVTAGAGRNPVSPRERPASPRRACLLPKKGDLS